MAKRKTTEEFIAQAKAMHGDLDSFDKVEYKGSKVKVCITCKEHGDYWMTPNCYLNGQRCPICGRRKVNQNKVISFDEFKSTVGNTSIDTIHNYIENQRKEQV